MSEPGQLSSRPYDDVAAFRQRIAREIGGARVARADAIGAFGRRVASAATDRAGMLVESATGAMMRWAMWMTPRSRRI